MSQGKTGTLAKSVDRKELVDRFLHECKEAMKSSPFGEKYENVVRYLKELSTGESQPRGVVGTFTVLEVDGRMVCWFIFPEWVVSSDASGDRAYLSLSECPEDVLMQIGETLCKEFGFDEFHANPDSCPWGKALVREARAVGDTVKRGQFAGGKVAFIY